MVQLPDAESIRERLKNLFEENFEKYGELGAGVSVWKDRHPLVDLCGGFRDARREHPWTADTIVLLWSATKGLGSACLLHALQEKGIGLDARVAQFWPEFAKSGKGTVTLAQLLSHQAGLCALDEPVDILNYEAVIAALENQVPLWPPGTAHGYHARTFGFLVEELIRRLTKMSAGEYWRANFADPLHLDIWVGLPPDQNFRVADIYAARSGRTPEPAAFYRDLTVAGTLARRTFTSPHGSHSVERDESKRCAQPFVPLFRGDRQRPIPGPVLCHAGERRGNRRARKFFNEKTLRWMTTTLADGIDRVFQIPTAFSAGFMKDSHAATVRIFGPSGKAFGHPGAGGSHGFADPAHGLSFAYVMNQMEQAVLPNKNLFALSELSIPPSDQDRHLGKQMSCLRVRNF